MCTITLNTLLNVTTCMNCKSGCDRTGITFAAAAAIKYAKIICTVFLTYLSLILQYRPGRDNLALLYEVIANFEDIEVPIEVTNVEEFINWVAGNAISRSALLMLEFRNLFFAVLIQVSIYLLLQLKNLPGGLANNNIEHRSPWVENWKIQFILCQSCCTKTCASFRTCGS